MSLAYNAVNTAPEWMMQQFEELSKHIRKQKHCGFDKPYDELFPIVIYFEDESIVVITGHSVDVYISKSKP
jgi:hypothetical protein